MRKTILKFLATLLIVSLLLTNLSGYSNVKADNGPKTVNVYVDPRIELLYTVELLSGYSVTGYYNTQYKKEILDYFSAFKSHPAVKKFKEMSRRGFGYDAPPAAMLCLSNPPELKIVIPFEKTNNEIIDRAGGEKNLESFVDTLRDFAIKTNFMDFFNAHKVLYSKYVDRLKSEEFNIYRNASILEDFYGVSNNSYNIILEPLAIGGGYASRIESEPSKFDIYAILEAGDYINYNTYHLSEILMNYTWHEFSHSFVNPITEKYRDEVNKYSKLFRPIAKVMRNQAYGKWEICVNEHIVRAVVAKLVEKYISKDDAEFILSREEHAGFIYIRGIYNIIDKYDKNRDKYKTFEDIYPEILDYFNKTSLNTPLVTSERTLFLILIAIFIFIAIGLLIFLKIRNRKK